MKNLVFAIALAGLGAGLAPGHAQSFFPIKEATCLNNVGSLFTVGGQYVDTDGVHLNPNNGVLPNSWSMLVRWQGDTIVQNPVNYNVGAFTGTTVPAPFSNWQRGFQPEDAQGTPAVQLYCKTAGMLINTWSTPHRTIVGGSYNDMYGYSWGTSGRPWAFRHVYRVFPVTYNIPSELVLQANIKVPFYGIWAGTPQVNPTSWTPISGSSETSYGVVQSDFFAYIADITHPELPPIAILAAAFVNRWSGCPTGANPQATVYFDYKKGVWFTGTGICTTDTTTVRSTGATTAGAAFSDSRFFRIHITRDNLVNLVNRINAMPFAKKGCATPGVDCPPVGYSTNPDNYVVNYAGVIDELSLERTFGVTEDAAADRQASMASGVENFGMYWYHP